MPVQILKNIRRDLRQNIDKEYKAGVARSYKESVVCYGVRTPIVRKLSRQYKKEIDNLNKKDLFILVEKLFQSGKNEEATLATAWLVFRKDIYTQRDFLIFEKWLDQYLDNWSKIDDYCLHVIALMIDKYPILKSGLKNKWTQSSNRWVRRGATVAFIRSGSGGYKINKEDLPVIFVISRQLWQDQAEMVRKGCGWLLKAATVGDYQKTLDFILKNKDKMHSQVLAYALEKVPVSVKKEIRQK
ncbi:MAG: DNA alkylation repair protein [Patescibacteria group bacterium]